MPSIPPPGPGSQSSQTPKPNEPSNEPTYAKNQHPQKEFNYKKNPQQNPAKKEQAPVKKEQNQGKSEEKKKKDDDGQGVVEGKVEAKQEGVSGKKEEIKTGKTEGIDASAKAMQTRQIASTIIKMVDKIAHGDGLTEMTLKASKDVPISFHGTTLTIDQTNSKISFANFKTGQAALDARRQILQSNEELQNLADRLYDRGFRSTTITLENNITIQLPQARQQPITPEQLVRDLSSMEREGGDQQGGQQGRGEQRGEGPDEQ